MVERQLCVDIPVEESQKFDTIVKRVEERKPLNGCLFVHHQGRWSCLRGGERTVLNKIVSDKVEGAIVAVDGIYPNAINASINLTSREADRLRESGFRIQAEIKIG